MTSTDGTARPWDLDQYKPGARRVAPPPRSEVPGQLWDESEGDGRRIRARYEPDGTPLLVLAGWTAILTVLTLGFYRFWMITRLRRHYWRAVRIDGDPMEYTGRGIEKFLGFLLALVCLAVYLGLVNLALTFVGLSIGNEIALNLSVLSVLPLYFFAVYRARRYILARTRWRGIRFGMENGAWAYTGRALVYGVATLLSAGLLYPLMHFKLEKFMVDRSWFGDQKFRQDGSWTGVLGNWVWIYIVVALMAITIWGVIDRPNDQTAIIIASIGSIAGAIAIMVLVLFYRIAAFRYFWENRTLGGASFDNDVSSGGVLGVYVGGSLLTGLCSMLVGIVLALAAGAIIAAVAGMEQIGQAQRVLEGDVGPGLLAAWPVLVLGGLFYLLFFASAFAFGQVFVTQPIIRRMTEGMTVVNPGQLSRSQQREHDQAAEAGGFADALGVDVGAGF